LVLKSAQALISYSSLTKITKYGKGWFRRLFDCHKTILEIVPKPGKQFDGVREIG